MAKKAEAEAGVPSNVVQVAALEAPAASIGIDNTVAFVKFGGALAAAIKGAKADGKFDIGDLALIFPVVPMIGPMVAGVGQVPKELGDLTSDELTALVAEVSKIEGIGDKANVVLKIKASLEFANAGYKLYQAFSKKE